ncbi:phosphatidylglycerophosphatase A family protein [Paenibacillus sp. y28]|uniref:phosphatidylglycerophosphatase A family protein n=1 Tax=Paenibacillus sp. y28 TaxID=3129110 RepID=UPI0030171281
MNYKLNSKEVEAATLDWLARRGVTHRQIAELVLYLQHSYFPDLTIEECEASVEKVLTKREVQNAILTGIQLDMLAEEGKLLPPLQEMVYHDEGLYGCDEVLSLSIVNVYGSIGYTNFGYIDKMKPGILAKLNDKSDGEIHTFLDDIVGAIAAAASSRLAHSKASEHSAGALRAAGLDNFMEELSTP